jgi:hypothetical protein
MTRAIVSTLPGRVEAATHDRAKRKPTDSMAAYECVLAAKVLHHRSVREDNAEAQRLLDRALMRSGRSRSTLIQRLSAAMPSASRTTGCRVSRSPFR